MCRLKALACVMRLLVPQCHGEDREGERSCARERLFGVDSSQLAGCVCQSVDVLFSYWHLLSKDAFRCYLLAGTLPNAPTLGAPEITCCAWLSFVKTSPPPDDPQTCHRCVAHALCLGRVILSCQHPASPRSQRGNSVKLAVCNCVATDMQLLVPRALSIRVGFRLSTRNSALTTRCGH